MGTLVLVLFVMLIAALNFCLGFAAAVHLGFGPPGWSLRATQPAGGEHPAEHAAPASQAGPH